MNEMPSISASSYTSATVAHNGPLDITFAAHGAANKFLGNLAAQPDPKGNPVMSTARIVKVFIADPNENLALDKRVIYSGEEKLTDSTDQELFFEVPIGDLLATQNALRATTVDKKASDKSGREIFLEPARIRDLKMVVVTIAQF